MLKSYINRVKANIQIYSNKKTKNILEGSYKSVYYGRSMDFEDLREYNYGDNIKDNINRITIINRIIILILIIIYRHIYK